MAKEIVKKEAQELSTELNSAWGAEEMSASDIRIPKILLAQALSQAVSDGKCDNGDLYNSISLEVLGNAQGPKKKETTISIVPIYLFKTWVVTEEINGKPEYFATEQFLPANANRPREEVVNGAKRQNNLTYNVLCMLEKDLDDPSAFPYVASFSRMSSNCGKDIATFAQKAAMLKKPACIHTIKLGAEFMKNEKGSFGVFKVRGVTETKDFAKHAGKLKMWYDTFKAGKAVVDESDVKEVVKEVSTEGTYEGQF